MTKCLKVNTRAACHRCASIAQSLPRNMVLTTGLPPAATCSRQAKSKPYEEARELVKGTRMDFDVANKPSATSTVWKFKEQPGWK